MAKNIEFTPPPTLAKFMASNANVRFVVGPYGPVSGRTEFLTPRGWKRIDQYEQGDLVAQWSPVGNSKTGELSFVAPDDYIVSPCGSMIRIRNRYSLFMEISENHRVPYYSWSGEFKVALGAEVEAHPSTRTIPTKYTVAGEGLEFTDTELQFGVAVNADGHLPDRRPGIVILSLRKKRKQDRLIALLNKLGYEYSHTVYSGRPTERIFTVRMPVSGLYSFLVENKKKFIGKWWNADQQQAKVILAESLLWDGHDSSGTAGGYRVFASNNKCDADYIQYLAHACNGRATIRKVNYNNPKWRPNYRVNIALPTGQKGDKTNVRIGGESEFERFAPPDGKQYCFSLPSTFFLARCEGRVFITGNSGKTYAMIMETLRRCAEHPPGPDGIRRTRVAIVRNTLTSLKQSVIPDIEQLLGPICNYKVSESTIQVRAGDIHSDWLLLPLEDQKDQRRLLSLQLTFAWLAEFRELDYDVVSAVTGRIGRYPSRALVPEYWSGVYGESNPFSEDSAWYKHLILELPEGWEFFRQPGGRSPDAENVENLPPNYYEEIARGKDPHWIKVHVDGEFGDSLAGTAVFGRSFNRDMHVGHGLLPITSKSLVIGMDTGRHPAAVVGQVDSWGRLIILMEAYGDGMGMETFITTILRPKLVERFGALAQCYVVIDPAGIQREQIGEESVVEAVRRLGFSTIIASTNKIEPRLRAVEKHLNTLLGDKAGLVIDGDACPMLVKAMVHDYRYARKKNGEYEEKPDKNHPASDLADALQYFCLGVGSNAMARDVLIESPMEKPIPIGAWT